MSTKLDMDFLSPGKTAKPGIEPSPVLIIAKVNKIGKNVGFTEASIFDEATGRVLCTGTHIKSFIDNKYDL